MERIVEQEKAILSSFLFLFQQKEPIMNPNTTRSIWLVAIFSYPESGQTALFGQIFRFGATLKMLPFFDVCTYESRISSEQI